MFFFLVFTVILPLLFWPPRPLHSSSVEVFTSAAAARLSLVSPVRFPEGLHHCRAAGSFPSQGDLQSIPGSPCPHKRRKISVTGLHMSQGLKQPLCLSPDLSPYSYWEERSQLGNFSFRVSFFFFPPQSTVSYSKTHQIRSMCQALQTH